MVLNATRGSPLLDEPQKASAALQDFVTQCFLMNPRARPTVDELLEVCLQNIYQPNVPYFYIFDYNSIHLLS